MPATKGEVARLFAPHEGKHGSPQITADLRAQTQRHHPPRQGAVADTRSGATRLPARQLNRKWVGDGTQITTDEGKLYLVSVLDVASRRVLGFPIAERHDAQMA